MATWHQQKAEREGRAHSLQSETKWTVVTDPPNGFKAGMAFYFEETANEYLGKLEKLGRGDHSYVLPPRTAQLPDDERLALAAGEAVMQDWCSSLKRERFREDKWDTVDAWSRVIDDLAAVSRAYENFDVEGVKPYMALLYSVAVEHRTRVLKEGE